MIAQILSLITFKLAAQKRGQKPGAQIERQIVQKVLLYINMAALGIVDDKERSQQQQGVQSHIEPITCFFRFKMKRHNFPRVVSVYFLDCILFIRFHLLKYKSVYEKFVNCDLICGLFFHSLTLWG